MKHAKIESEKEYEEESYFPSSYTKFLSTLEMTALTYS